MPKPHSFNLEALAYPCLDGRLDIIQYYFKAMPPKFGDIRNCLFWFDERDCIETPNGDCEVHVTDDSQLDSSFTEILLLATEGGHLNLIEYFYDYFDFKTRSQNYILEAYSEKRKGDILSVAIEYGHLPIVEFLVKTVGLNQTHLKSRHMLLLMDHHRLEILSYLKQSLKLRKEILLANHCLLLKTAVEQNRENFLESLCQLFEVTFNDIRPEIINILTLVPNVKTLKFLHQFFELSQPLILSQNHRLLKSLIKRGDLDLVSYLNQETELTKAQLVTEGNQILKEVISQGHLHLLMYFRLEFSLQTEDIREDSSQLLESVKNIPDFNKQLEILRYLYRNFEI